MRFDPPLEEATFISGPDRFLVGACLNDGTEVMALVANSVRLKELIHPDNTLILARATVITTRRMDHDLVLMEVAGTLVSADARLPNTLFAEALEARKAPEFSRHAGFRREVRLSGEPHRFRSLRPGPRPLRRGKVDHVGGRWGWALPGRPDRKAPAAGSTISGGNRARTWGGGRLYRPTL